MFFFFRIRLTIVYQRLVSILFQRPPLSILSTLLSTFLSLSQRFLSRLPPPFPPYLPLYPSPIVIWYDIKGLLSYISLIKDWSYT